MLDAIYAAYSIEWLRVAGPDVVDHVTEQAIHASQLLLAALPRNHEVRGLAALLLYLYSRRDTRIEAGVLMPAAEPDETRWDRTLIAHAEAHLATGLKNRTAPPGQYALQAAIQSAHSSRATGESAPWDTIARLYDALVLTTPSRGARVARAVAVARATEAAIGLRMLQALIAADPAYESFQPFHVAMAALLAASGASADSLDHLARAIDLCTHAPSRRYLEQLRAEPSTTRTPPSSRSTHHISQVRNVPLTALSRTAPGAIAEAEMPRLVISSAATPVK